ncbi:DUF2080 family transposase-associated protein [Candidatus Woesearchaeota archaeon]|nr:DUF2080 family transposase-associated protein [Candidatus Woesearchaeota archaeon]
MKMQMDGFEVVEKIAEKGGNSARIYVPKKWTGNLRKQKKQGENLILLAPILVQNLF